MRRFIRSLKVFLLIYKNNESLSTEILSLSGACAGHAYPLCANRQQRALVRLPVRPCLPVSLQQD